MKKINNDNIAMIYYTNSENDSYMNLFGSLSNGFNNKPLHERCNNIDNMVKQEKFIFNSREEGIDYIKNGFLNKTLTEDCYTFAHPNLHGIILVSSVYKDGDGIVLAPLQFLADNRKYNVAGMYIIPANANVCV